MATLLQILGGLWFAFGFATCAVGLTTPADDARGMALVLIVILFLGPGLTLYLWGARMKKRDRVQEEIAEALKRRV